MQAQFQTRFEPNKNSNGIKPISNSFKFPQAKQDLPGLKKFEIKYGWRELWIWNNFPYKGFLRFKMDFDLKFREASMTQISIEIHWKFLKLWNLMKFG
jgi:hypothetical protein